MANFLNNPCIIVKQALTKHNCLRHTSRRTTHVEDLMRTVGVRCAARRHSNVKDWRRRSMRRTPSRRRLLQMLGAVSAVGAGGWALLSGSRANAYYAGPVSDHFDGARFFNPNGVRPRGPGAFLKWQLNDRGEPWPASYPSPFRDSPPARFEREGVRIAFVGHATFLIQTRGK